MPHHVSHETRVRTLHASSVRRYSDARAWRAYMGMRVMTVGNNGAAARQIRRILLHPKYDQFSSDYDIALLELSTPVFFNDLVQPVCIPASSHVFSTGTNCYVTGWGVLMEDGRSRSKVSDGTEARARSQIFASILQNVSVVCLCFLKVSWPLAYKRRRWRSSTGTRVTSCTTTPSLPECCALGTCREGWMPARWVLLYEFLFKFRATVKTHSQVCCGVMLPFVITTKSLVWLT